MCILFKDLNYAPTIFGSTDINGRKPNIMVMIYEASYPGKMLFSSVCPERICGAQWPAGVIQLHSPLRLEATKVRGGPSNIQTPTGSFSGSITSPVYSGFSFLFELSWGHAYKAMSCPYCPCIIQGNVCLHLITIMSWDIFHLGPSVSYGWEVGRWVG